MDIYEFAMQMENDGKNYYLELANKTPKQGLKSIFIMLADDEEIHYNILKAMRKKNPTLYESKILDKATNIFQELKKSEKDYTFPQSILEAYKKAQDIEKKSIDYYNQKSREVTSPEKQKIFESLAQEERKHFILIENILEFITKPGFWV